MSVTNIIITSHTWGKRSCLVMLCTKTTRCENRCPLYCILNFCAPSPYKVITNWYWVHYKLSVTWCKGTLYNMPLKSTIHLWSLQYISEVYNMPLKLANSLWTHWNLFTPCGAYSAPSLASCLHSTVGPHCLMCPHWSIVHVSLM